MYSPETSIAHYKNVVPRSGFTDNFIDNGLHTPADTRRNSRRLRYIRQRPEQVAGLMYPDSVGTLHRSRQVEFVPGGGGQAEVVVKASPHIRIAAGEPVLRDLRDSPLVEDIWSE